MSLVGVILQLVGLIVAAGALAWEVRAARSPQPLDLPDPTKDLTRIANPWGGTTRGGLPLARMVHIGRGEGSPAVQLQRVATLLAEQVDADRRLAKTGWEAQTRAVAALAAANQALLADQLEHVAESQRHMRVRVLIEMAGLVLAIVGTVLAAL